MAMRCDVYLAIIPDIGCKAGGPSCLSCVLPECVLIERQRSQNGENPYAERNAAIYADWQAMPVKYIPPLVEKYGLGKRQILRALQEQRKLHG